jgi:hypothetical protein
MSKCGSATLLIPPRGAAALRRLGALFRRLRTWISHVAMDDETAYLSRATDMADLERRLRVLDLTRR